jgi:hypothetical protein
VAKKRGPGRVSRPNASKRVRHDGTHTGRYVSAQESGRVTAATPRTNYESPRWMLWAILGTFGLGLLMIALNYLNVLPGSVSPWYLVAGLVSIFAGFYLATKYH